MPEGAIGWRDAGGRFHELRKSFWSDLKPPFDIPVSGGALHVVAIALEGAGGDARRGALLRCEECGQGARAQAHQAALRQRVLAGATPDLFG